MYFLFTGLLLGLANVSTTGASAASAVTWIACGWIGMSIAVKTNVKTTHESYKPLGDGFYVALEETMQQNKVLRVIKNLVKKCLEIVV